MKPRDSLRVRPEDAPFHQGERAVQTRAGVRERMARVPARAFRDAMPEQHRAFFQRLPWLLVASVDAQLQPWASVLVGPPGFLRSPDPQTLDVHARPLPGDPLQRNLRQGAAMGTLGIELHTRRRNRMNGVIMAAGEHGFTLRVGQSFGNCNQYIQAREPRLLDDPPAVGAVRAFGPNLSQRARQLVMQADTFFIASATHTSQGMGGGVHGADVSHRGGNPGFVRIDGSVLTFPDYPGNNFFNTLGNLELWPRAGLLFVDFDAGDLLLLAGSTEVVWDGAELRATPGAQRLVRVRVTSGVYLERALPLRWSAAELSDEALALRR